jgi:hypothetical protein
MKILLPFFSLVLMIGSANAQSNLTACPQSGYFDNCFGTKTYANGGKYIGAFKDDKRSGRGTMTYANGSEYVGEWNDDKGNGQGIYTTANGDKVFGGFIDFKMNGYVIIFKPSGEIQSHGTFVNNQPQKVAIKENQELFTVLDFLEYRITNSRSNSFYNILGKNLPENSKEDFLVMIRNQKERVSIFPSGVYSVASRALQQGIIYAPCSKNGQVDVNCIDFSRYLLIPKSHPISFDISKEASERNVTHLPIAQHYKNGWIVPKNLKLAYDSYKKEGLIRDANLQDSSILQMLNDELKLYDSNISSIPTLDNSKCDFFKLITGSIYCGLDHLDKMFDSLTFENVKSKSNPVNPSDLNGDWISDIPLVVGKFPIKGFDFGNEGIMYASLKDNVRSLPSSFNYKIENNILEFEIKFSVAELPVGSKLKFTAWKTVNGSLMLSVPALCMNQVCNSNQTAIYKRTK